MSFWQCITKRGKIHGFISSEKIETLPQKLIHINSRRKTPLRKHGKIFSTNMPNGMGKGKNELSRYNKRIHC